MKNIKLSSFNIALLGVVLFLFSACEPSNETQVQISVQSSAAGPFFPGPNSLMADYEVNLAALKGLENVSPERIKDIKINSISLNLNEADSINFASFSSASLQIVGSNTGMQTIAIKNPISSKTRELALQVSDEVKIVDYFKSEKFSLVLDLDFIDESYDEEIGAMIVMDLTIKYN